MRCCRGEGQGKILAYFNDWLVRLLFGELSDQKLMRDGPVPKAEACNVMFLPAYKFIFIRQAKTGTRDAVPDRMVCIDKLEPVNTIASTCGSHVTARCALTGMPRT